MLIIYLAALESFEERGKMASLYNNHKRRLMYTALSITHNREMAEDAVENTFLAAIKQKDKVFKMDDEDFLRWSIIVIKHKCIDLLRKETHYSETPIEDMQLISDEQSPDDFIVQQNTYELMRKYINDLDDLSKLALEMKYISDLTMKEIGAELGISPTQVNNKIARAKAKVRKSLESEMQNNG